jgi:hypothetical protein
MPSFAFSSRFRENQWRDFRRFMLEERRDATSRFLVIDAERQRIGNVNILYELTDTGATEKRVGISVSPPESSLAKLLMAYVALGGNPFDISMFLSPDRSVEIDGETVNDQPAGVIHTLDIKYSYDQGVADGDTNLVKFKGSRMGGGRIAAKEFEILAITSHARKWIQKEIHFKRTRIEEQIIKLCDLREQLDQEVGDLLWATYGDMQADQDYDTERYNDSLTAGAIAYFFDSIFRVPDKAEIGKVSYDDTADSGKDGSANTDVLGGFPSLMSDDDSEDNTAL